MLVTRVSFSLAGADSKGGLSVLTLFWKVVVPLLDSPNRNRCLLAATTPRKSEPRVLPAPLAKSLAAPKTPTVPMATAAQGETAAAAASTAAAPAAPQSATAATGAGDDLAPAVRRLVAEHDLDPEAISGTGKGGRITKEDVLAHLAKPAAPERPRLKRLVIPARVSSASHSASVPTWRSSTS